MTIDPSALKSSRPNPELARKLRLWRKWSDYRDRILERRREAEAMLAEAERMLQELPDDAPDRPHWITRRSVALTLLEIADAKIKRAERYICGRERDILRLIADR